MFKFYNHVYHPSKFQNHAIGTKREIFANVLTTTKKTLKKISRLRYDLSLLFSSFFFSFLYIYNQSCRICFVLQLFAALSASSKAEESASSEIPRTQISAAQFQGPCILHRVQPIRLVSSPSLLTKHTPHPHQPLKLDHL